MTRPNRRRTWNMRADGSRSPLRARLSPAKQHDIPRGTFARCGIVDSGRGGCGGQYKRSPARRSSTDYICVDLVAIEIRGDARGTARTARHATLVEINQGSPTDARGARERALESAREGNPALGEWEFVLLVYVDSPAVNAVKHGRILILEGIDKAERGIMPESGRRDAYHAFHRYAQLGASTDGSGNLFIATQKNFRVSAIAAPVPPFPDHPLDPPFRSRFQARFVDPVGAFLALCAKPDDNAAVPDIESRLRESSVLPPFPRTALQKLRALIATFPPPDALSPAQLARLVLTLHPALVFAPMRPWAILSRQTEEAGLGELGSPATADADEASGLLKYTLARIARVTPTTATALFTHPSLPAAHALGWDVSLVPPPARQHQHARACIRRDTGVRWQGGECGNAEAVHMYKELGGRELLMRRRILDGGVATWEPSAIVEAAWVLVHLSGLDVIGPTAGVARLVQDRQAELWVGSASSRTPRAVSGYLQNPTSNAAYLRSAHGQVDVSPTPYMFFPVPAQSMGRAEEEAILRASGCPARLVGRMLAFAEHYRASISEDDVQKNRKLGTRSLVRIARRMAVDSGAGAEVEAKDREGDLRAVLSRALLLEFLRGVKRMNVDQLFDEAGIPQALPERRRARLPGPEHERGPVVFDAYPALQRRGGSSGGQPHVLYMDHFDDNSFQTELMRDLAVDLELLGEHVVAIFRSLAGQNELSLSDGCRVLGETFSAHSVTNPGQASERTLLAQLAREIDKDLILHCVLRAHRPTRLSSHVPHLGLAAAREAAAKKIQECPITPALRRALRKIIKKYEDLTIQTDDERHLGDDELPLSRRSFDDDLQLADRSKSFGLVGRQVDIMFPLALSWTM
ncbi:hypothetical protein B0H13DRAFT_2279068 [Mycena leptocephala]|nr:hypothetical protein B0H13DRAFT_2279068 [Mycena leptocephala]